MCSDAPPTCTREVYENYVKLLLSVFYVVCQSLGELRHLVRLLSAILYNCFRKKYMLVLFCFQ